MNNDICTHDTPGSSVSAWKGGRCEAMRTTGMFVAMAIAVLMMFEGCATKTVPPDAFVVSGRMNPVSGSKAMKTDRCWVLESGNDLRSLKYYRIAGSKELMEQLYEEDMVVTIRVVPATDADDVCTVGTPVKVVEILEARSKKN